MSNNINNLENFRPHSPISLYSYIGPGAALAKTNDAAEPPKQINNAPTKPTAGTAPAEGAGKSILKNSLALPVPQQQQQQHKVKPAPASRPTTPTGIAKNNIKQKTVAFGLTTNLSDTVEKKKETVPRLSRPLMTTMKEAEEIHKQLRAQKEELERVKSENGELKKTLEEIRLSESKTARLLTNISSRLMELEKQRPSHSSSSSTKPTQPQQEPIPLPPPPQPQIANSQPQRKHRQTPSSTENNQLQLVQQPAVQPQREKQVQVKDVANYSGRDDKRMEDFISFIRNRIRDSPDFEERINRTVMLFGGGPGVASIPTTIPESQRLPLREAVNDTNSASYYGAKFTQRLTVHKEITTYSPDRNHLPPPPQRIAQSSRHSNEERFFIDDESDQDYGYQQHQDGGGNARRQVQNSSDMRRDRYRRN